MIPAAAMAAGEDDAKDILKISYSLDGRAQVSDGTAVSRQDAAQVGGQNFRTLAEAVEAAGSGAAVKLLCDVTLLETLNIPESKNLTLDLNGHAIRAAAAGAGVENHGTLTITDSSAVEGANGVGAGHIYTSDVEAQGRHAVVNYGTLTINGGIFGDNDTDQTNANKVQRGNAVRNYGTAVINGGAFTCCDNYVKDGYAYAIANGTSSYPNAALTIEQAVVYGKMNGVLACDGGVLTAKGGTYTLGSGSESNLWRMAYTSGEGRMEIQGGTYTKNVNNNYGFFGDYGGGISISGGTFENGADGKGILVDQGVVSITDGTFKDDLTAGSEKITVVISGGSYTNDVSKFLQDGFRLESTEGNYSAVPGGSSTFAGGSGTQTDPYLIRTADQLKAFRDKVNSGKTYAGQYIKLDADIALDATSWTPIGNGERSGNGYSGNAFLGSFDGAGKTISGLAITGTDNYAGDKAIGLFGVVAGGTVENVILTDVSINVTDNKCAGGVAGLVCNNGVIRGCQVSGSVSILDGAGGIVGRMVVSGTIENCVNHAAVTTAEGGAAGIVGKAYYTKNDMTMTIKDCVNTGAITNAAYHAGGISALCAANVSGCSNSGAITAGSTAGGIIAEQVNWGTVSGNTNTGAVKGDVNAGGIVGWVRYQTSSYEKSDVISVLDNVNRGTIGTMTTGKTGGLGWGGIVGGIYNAALVSGNENTAPSITGGTFAAGVVGNLQKNSGNMYHDAPNIRVANNVSSTALDAITVDGTCKDLYAYNNDPAFTVEHNSPAWAAQIDGRKYATLAAAFAAAQSGDTVTLLADVESATAITVPVGITLDGGGKAINCTAAIENGAFVNAGGNGVTIQNVTINTNGNVKHGVQFYRVNGGKLSGVTVNGGRYTSVVINGSTNIVLENCTLNPDNDAYANVEYGMGDGVTTIPSVTVSNVTGDSDKPLIYVDQATLDRIKTAPGGASEQDAINKIKDNVVNNGSTDIVIDLPGNQDITISAPHQGGSGVTTYSVTVEKSLGGTVKASPTWAAKGGTVTVTVTPDEGYVLSSLDITDKNGKTLGVTDKGNGKYTFTMPGSKVTIKAVFVKDDTAVSTLPFTDVDVHDWFYDAVKYAYDNKLMDGTSSTSFAPATSTSRAMIVTILWRMEGSPVVNYAMGFGDVANGTWYTEAVRWAASEGIVTGYTDTVFGPDDTVTREQLAAVLYRYAQYKDYDMSAKGELNGFLDNAKVSGWAKDAMSWGVGADLMNGKNGSLLDPTGTATRAEVAQLLMNFAEAFEKK